MKDDRQNTRDTGARKNKGRLFIVGVKLVHLGAGNEERVGLSRQLWQDLVEGDEERMRE